MKANQEGFGEGAETDEADTNQGSGTKWLVAVVDVEASVVVVVMAVVLGAATLGATEE